MAKESSRICPCCGREIVSYKHLLNSVLVSGLEALAEAGGEASISELHLQTTVYNNFQKLRYFGLVEKVPKTRIYKITDLGRAFLNSAAPAPGFVVTEDANVIFRGPAVWLEQVRGEIIETREDWEA